MGVIRSNTKGQTTVEFALLILFFLVAFFSFIQVGLIAVHKHELNGFCFEIARYWSLMVNPDIDEAINAVSTAYRENRDETPMAEFMAITLNAKACNDGIRFYGWIPLLIPGAAHLITDELGTGGRPYEGIAAAAASSLNLPMQRAVAVRIWVPMKLEPTLGLDKYGCGGANEPACYDNEGCGGSGQPKCPDSRPSLPTCAGF
jgi:hypothetical protein